MDPVKSGRAHGPGEEREGTWALPYEIFLALC